MLTGLFYTYTPTPSAVTHLIGLFWHVYWFLLTCSQVSFEMFTDLCYTYKTIPSTVTPSAACIQESFTRKRVLEICQKRPVEHVYFSPCPPTPPSSRGSTPNWCPVAVRCNVWQCVAMCCSVLQCVAVRYNVLQCVATCCSALQCVAVHNGVLNTWLWRVLNAL